MAQGELAAAQVRAEDALALVRRAPDSWGLASEIHMLRARLALAAGRPVDAEAAAQQTLLAQTRAEPPFKPAEAHALLALALLKQNKVAAAPPIMNRAQALIGDGQAVLARLTVTVAAARVTAATGQRTKIDAALQELARVQAEALRRGLVGYGLEARLAEREIRLATGSRDSSPGLADAEQRCCRAGLPLDGDSGRRGTEAVGPARRQPDRAQRTCSAPSPRVFKFRDFRL